MSCELGKFLEPSYLVRYCIPGIRVMIFTNECVLFRQPMSGRLYVQLSSQRCGVWWSPLCLLLVRSIRTYLRYRCNRCLQHILFLLSYCGCAGSSEPPLCLYLDGSNRRPREASERRFEVDHETRNAEHCSTALLHYINIPRGHSSRSVMGRS